MREGVIGMPIIRVNGAALYYEEHGTGPETVVFAHGLLWSCRMFDAQVALLKDRYRCVAFDFRGQGQSEVTRFCGRTSTPKKPGGGLGQLEREVAL